MSNPILTGTDLSVAYGGVQAVDRVNLEVYEEEIVGLIGPNGAGKTSLIDGMSGFASMTGAIQLNGRSLMKLRAHQRRKAGLSRTWQSVNIFDDLTVLENVKIAASRRDEGVTANDQARRALERFGLSELENRLPGELSHGQRVLTGVARAAIGNPALILMDEPAAGLDDSEGSIFADQIRALTTGGTAVLVIDHDMNLMLDVCDRLYVLDFGKLIAEGTPDEVASDPAVVAAYLGSSRDATNTEATSNSKTR